jgi:hypothetical protein
MDSLSNWLLTPLNVFASNSGILSFLKVALIFSGTFSQVSDFLVSGDE